MEEEGLKGKTTSQDILDEVSTIASGMKQDGIGGNQEDILSSNSLTYYYSSFDLFTNNNPTFLKYSRFIAKLQHYLGPDWKIYANQMIFQQLVTGQRIYLDSQTIFESCLEIWLQMRKEFSKKSSVTHKDVVQSKMYPQMEEEEEEEEEKSDNVSQAESVHQEINFSMFEENEMFEEFSVKFSRYFPQYLKEPMIQKPVLQGFFLGAIETWNYILKNPPKKESKTDSFKQVLDNFQEKIIKPIMLVSQKITGYFVQQQKQNEENREMNEGLLRSFSNFTSNMNEEEMLLEKMKSLQINEEEDIKNQKQETLGPVTIKKIQGQSEKALNNAIVKFAQTQLQNIVNNTEKQWSVARGFVTSIIEIKYNNLQSYAKNMKIKFLQPAQEYYNSLLDTYILFKSNNYTHIQFKDFLEKTKASLGNKWNDSLVFPTQEFFQTLIQQWNTTLDESRTENRDDETIIKLFVQKVRNKMADKWDENIVLKAQEGISE